MGCDVMLVVQTLRDYFQPDAIDHIFTHVDKFASYVRTDQPVEKFSMEFGILGRKVEKRMLPAGGGAFPTSIFASCALARRYLNQTKRPSWWRT